MDYKDWIKEVYVEKLLLKNVGCNPYEQWTVGREDRFQDDDGGHLITQIFGDSKYFNNRLL